jgi:aerobic-type carbon monoxide dehydrogenase small subunit (CoxS/CutS family)
MTTERVVEVEVNGRGVRRPAADDRLLRDFLRDDLGLTGTKAACDDGMCGACAVHLDGEVVKSCMILAAYADGRAVTTVEGLGDGTTLHPVQQAMIDHFGFQCGFCTPGFVMTAAAIIDAGHRLSEAEWREALAGNICRCTGYTPIVDACLAASAMVDGGHAG